MALMIQNSLSLLKHNLYLSVQVLLLTEYMSWGHWNGWDSVSCYSAEFWIINIYVDGNVYDELEYVPTAYILKYIYTELHSL